MVDHLDIDSIMANMRFAIEQAEALRILIVQIADQIKTIEKEHQFTKSKLSDLRSLIASWNAQNIPVNDEVLRLECSMAEEMKKIDELNDANASLRIYVTNTFGHEFVSPPTDCSSSIKAESTSGSNNHFQDVPENSDTVPRPAGTTERNVFEEVIIGSLRICGSMSRNELKNMLYQALEQRFSEDDLALSPDNTPTWWDTARGAIYNLTKAKRISFNKDEGTYCLNQDYAT